MKTRIAGNSVGVDYHADSLRVTVMDNSGKRLMNRRFENDVEQLISAVERFGAIDSVAVEAGTGSACFADAVRERTGWRVKQCHPGYVRRMKANPDKTDTSDADLVCDLNRVGYLPEVWLAPLRIRELRSLVRYRDQLVKQNRNTKLRVQAVLRNLRIKCPEKSLWTRAGQAWLKEAIREMPEQSAWIVQQHLIEFTLLVERIAASVLRIAKAVEDDSITCELMKEKGIGLITAAVMRAEIGDFHRFRSGKQLARFCGFSPQNASSGKRQSDAGLIKAGNRLLKMVLVQAAHLLQRHQEHWRDFARRLKAQGKHTCVVIGAVANRWLRRLYHQMTQKTQSALAA